MLEPPILLAHRYPITTKTGRPINPTQGRLLATGRVFGPTVGLARLLPLRTRQRPLPRRFAERILEPSKETRRFKVFEIRILEGNMLKLTRLNVDYNGNIYCLT